jgi:4-diphosphocytidyl-2-C-methyl-D-erythritol kinase
MKSINITARAKINLSLAVKYRRPDGFHEIESIFQEVEFGDDLFLQQAGELTFETDSVPLQAESDNLCLQAAKLMSREYQIPGLYIRLNKKIPLGSGLGGGSSDAAAVIKGINIIYDLNLSYEVLNSLAAKLGSDIPFFITGGSAYVYGRGEKVQALKLDTDYRVFLLHPDVSINTGWAYANLKMGLTKDGIETKFIGFEFQNLSLENFRDKFHNDFENSIFAAYPQLGESKQLLYRSGADFASMSGSGATIYGLFRSDKQAHAVYQQLKTRYSCTITRPVTGK